MNIDQACAEEIKRLRREAEEAEGSIDRLTYNLERAYWDLAAVVGVKRANSLIASFIQEVQ